MHRIQAILIALAISLQICAPAQKRVHSDGLDDVLRLTPYLAVYTMKLSGVQSRSDWKSLAVNTATSVVLCAGTTWILKECVSKKRPDGSDFNSFPSGHASIAFAGAQMLHKEYGHISPWISVGGYAVATFTAIDRVRRDRHDWLDVGAGVAIGIASTELGYWIGDKLTGRNKDVRLSLGPTGVAMALTF